MNHNKNKHKHKLTVEQFYSTDDITLKNILYGMNYNEKKLFLIELSESMAVPTLVPESTEADLHDAQERIDIQGRINKVWRVYKDDSVSDLLLNMTEEERKMVLKQLGHKHEIDALIYVGIYKRYENAKKRKDDVRRIFDAIDDERRNRLLNDIIYEKEGVPYYATYTFNELMKVLKEASVEYKEIADMLLGVKYKSLVARMIDQISTKHRDKYVVDILMSIDDDNDLGNMISGLKDRPVLAARVLNGADDIGKFTRLFNIIKSSGISKDYMKTVLDKLVINDKIVSELRDKPRYKQNEILDRIDNIQPAVIGKIKCSIREAEAEERRKEEKRRKAIITVEERRQERRKKEKCEKARITAEEWQKAIEKWIDTYKRMNNEGKIVEYIKATENDLLLIDTFKYISHDKSKNEANQIFSKIENNLLGNILKVLHPSLYIYFYACLDKDSAEYFCKHYQIFDGNYLIERVMYQSVIDGIEDKKMMWIFLKDFADNSRYKEWIIEGLMWITESALDIIVNGVETESEFLPGLISGEFLKSMLEKESDRKKKHEIMSNVVNFLDYFRSDDVVKDVVSAITDMDGLEKALDKIIKPVVLARLLNGITHEELLIRETEALVLFIERGEYGFLADVLNVISNKDIARTVVQKCVMCMNDPIALAETANNVKDKEIVYCIMEVLKQNGMLMNKEMFSYLRVDRFSVMFCGVPGASDKPRLIESHEAAKILGCLNYQDVAKILSYPTTRQNAAKILECMNDKQKYAIDNMMKDISLAEELNKIGADNIEGLRATFDSRNRGMTVMLFKHLDIDVMKTIVHVMMNPNEKKSLLIDLIKSMAVFTAESMGQYLYYVQERIDKIWQVYGVGSVSDLLLDMSDDERNLVLKQLGCEHKIDVLIHVGTEKKYENAEGGKDDLKKIFDAIEDKRRKELLNDTFKKKGWSHNKNIFDKLMAALKGSVESNKIADMLLGVKSKSLVIDMIVLISKQHEGNNYVADILMSIRNDDDLGRMIFKLRDQPILIATILSRVDGIGKLSRLLNGVSSEISNKYMADILLSIDDDDLGNMISKLKEWPQIIARILSGANDINKLSRLFNIIKSSGISKDYMEIVLANIEINAKIVNELTDKPKNEQNEILGEINNTQLVDKIKCKIKEEEVGLLLSICRKFHKAVFDRCRNTLDNMSEVFNGSNRAEFESYEAFMEKVKSILMLETFYKLFVSKGLADSDALKMFNMIDTNDDAQQNESCGVVEKREDIVDIIATIKRIISGMEESMKDTNTEMLVKVLEDNLWSMDEKLRKMVCDMIIDIYKMDDYSTTESLYELLNRMDYLIFIEAKVLYKKVYDQVVSFCNEIEKKIYICLMKRMLDIASLIACEIDKAVMRYNECIKRFEDEKMTPKDLNSILITVVKSMCKELVNNDHMLSNQSDKEIEETIKALPYVGEIIRNCESNPLISGAQNKIRAILFAAIIVISAYSGTIIQKIEDRSKTIPAIEVSEPKRLRMEI